MSAAKLPNTIWDDMPVVKYKRPAKLKKPKQAKLAGAKAVRAVRTWQLGTTTGPECRPYHAAKRAFVLPADAASVERMVELGAMALGGPFPLTRDIVAARKVLASLGITSAKGRA